MPNLKQLEKSIHSYILKSRDIKKTYKEIQQDFHSTVCAIHQIIQDRKYPGTIETYFKNRFNISRAQKFNKCSVWPHKVSICKAAKDLSVHEWDAIVKYANGKEITCSIINIVLNKSFLSDESLNSQCTVNIRNSQSNSNENDFQSSPTKTHVQTCSPESNTEFQNSLVPSTATFSPKTPTKSNKLYSLYCSPQKIDELPLICTPVQSSPYIGKSISGWLKSSPDSVDIDIEALKAQALLEQFQDAVDGLMLLGYEIKVSTRQGWEPLNDYEIQKK